MNYSDFQVPGKYLLKIRSLLGRGRRVSRTSITPWSPCGGAIPSWTRLIVATAVATRWRAGSLLTVTGRLCVVAPRRGIWVVATRWGTRVVGAWWSARVIASWWCAWSTVTRHTQLDEFVSNGDKIQDMLVLIIA